MLTLSGECPLLMNGQLIKKRQFCSLISHRRTLDQSNTHLLHRNLMQIGAAKAVKLSVAVEEVTPVKQCVW